MTITIQAPPEVEEKLIQAAAQEGVSVEDYTLQAVLQKADAQRQEHGAPDRSASPETLTPVQALFAQWENHPTTDLAELARRRRETVELFDKLNREAQAEKPFYARATKEEWLAAFHEWIESHDSDLPVLTDEQMRRDHLYEDRY